MSGTETLFVEENQALPLVDVCIRWRAGAEFDPEDQTGLARLLARTMGMGPRGMGEQRFGEAIAALGGRLSIHATRAAIRVQGTVLRRNLDAFVGLLARVMHEPALRAADLQRQKRDTRALLVARRDDDESLAHRHYRAMLFGGHPYARSAVGDERSVRRIGVSDLRAFHAAHLRRGGLLFGFAGAITETDAQRIVEAHFGDLAVRAPKRPKVRAPRMTKGRRVIVVDKPERMRTQTYIGTLGAKLGDERLDGLIVSNTAFGGTFSSRLNHEVRTRLGYTYGAHSQLGRAAQREAWTMSSAPEAEFCVACIARQIELMEDWIARGVRGAEVKSARQALVGAYGFDIETAAKRLDIRLERALHGLDPEAYRQYPTRMRAVSLAEANEATRTRLDPSRLAIVVVAEASAVADQLAALPGVTSVEVRPFTAPLPV